MGIKKVDSIWLDGKLVAWDDATDHMLAHTMHYGVGAFEGIRAYQRADGRTAVFRLREHIERLFDSSAICTMDVPFTRDQVIAGCTEVLRANKMAFAYLRPLIYLGSGALGLGSFEPPVRTMIAAFEWGAYLGEDGAKKGIRCMISGFTRANGNAVMNKGKICGQYVTSVLAKRMALKSGFDEALMLDPQGYVAEGTGENIFVVKNGVIYTPDLSAGALNGITRNTIFHIAKDLGLEIVQKRITRDEVYIADEAFFTGTAAEVTPIRELDRIELGKGDYVGSRGPITEKIQTAFFDIVNGRNPQYAHWLTKV